MMRFQGFFSRLVNVGLVLAVVFIQIGLAIPVSAAPRKGYEAQLSSTFSTALTFAPGETRTIQLPMKNIGTVPWKNSGEAYVSFYTSGHRGRSSAFATPSWIDQTHPVKLTEASVLPKAVGNFALTLRAPEKVGVYKETFELAAEDTTWIPGGVITLTISVKSAAKKGFEALIQSESVSEIVVEPGKTHSVEVAFKNIGTSVWKNTGASFVSLYTTNPSEHPSVLAAKDWVRTSQPAKLKEAQVKPGEVGHVTFSFLAPQKVGTYKESFSLAAEDTTWIPGGAVSFSVKVVDNPYAAAILIRSQKTVVAQGNEQIYYKVGIKNTGSMAWQTREVRQGDFALAAENAQTTRLAYNEKGAIEPGAMDFLSFVLTTPPSKGTYTLKYQFVANGKTIPEAEIMIPVEVTEDAGDLLNSPIINNLELQNIIVEPTVRIGVLIVDEETQNEVRISCATDWRLTDGNGSELAILPANSAVRAFYKEGFYSYELGGIVKTSATHLRFVPSGASDVCKIENFDKRVTRRGAYAENQFRGALELRYNTAKNRTWVINEIKMEDYLAGLGETSELSNYEFKKTLITIARTYAVYQFERATKHADEYFHMNAYADDQVYRGYEYEKNNPSIRKAAEETRGVTVNYEGKTAITPYFSRSDGRTRNWGEVWYGTVPWIKSVPCPCDEEKGRTLWGHGVGLSASEALCMANNGQKWEEILRYFYTGIDLRKRWY